MSKHPSYAQARLFLGITNVGFWVCVSLAALLFDLAGRYFPTEPITGRSLYVSLAMFLGGYVILQAPFDWLGGYTLPTTYRRFYEDFSDFVTNWLRGVVVQFVVLFLIGLAWLFYGNWLLAVAGGCLFSLMLLQIVIARLIGCFQSRGENAWKSADDAFTGGIVGMPGLQVPIFVTGRGQRLRLLDERRRFHLLKMELPTAGVVIAVTFNLVGILLISLCVGHPLNSLAGLVEMAFLFTLWSFLGLLTLPSLSRPAVYAGDYALYAKGVSQEEFARYLQSDASQAGEESRGNWTERIFHPVPCPVNRLERWGKAPGWTGGWHAARYAIYLSWTGLSLLNRAVHCNVGKPNVWVMLPCD